MILLRDAGHRVVELAAVFGVAAAVVSMSLPVVRGTVGTARLRGAPWTARARVPPGRGRRARWSRSGAPGGGSGDRPDAGRVSRASRGGGMVIEAIGALVVVSVGVFAVALLVGGIVHSNRSNDRTGVAEMATTNRMEGLLAGVPLRLDSSLSLGRHPSGESSYFGIRATGEWETTTVTPGAHGYPYVGAWAVVDVSGTRCLRRLEVEVWNAAASDELASLTTYANCP